MHRYQRQITR